MLRRCYTGLSAAVLAAASLQAPFAHVHPADPDHHHARGLSHAHFLEHHPESQEREWAQHEDDEATIYLDWAPSAAQRVGITHAVVASGWTRQPELARSGAAPEFEPRAHSPPVPRLSAARAPPL